MKQRIKGAQYAAKQTEPVLCYIDSKFPKTSENVVLAYQVDLQTVTPFGKQRYFVDAQSGKMICEFPLILEEGVPSKAQTKYYGVQNIITDSLGPQSFKLHDPTRAGGISVLNNLGNPFTSTSSFWNLTNAAKDEVALDAHYCTQEFFDMMKEDYDWIGLDDNGKELVVNVHMNDIGSVNAFWDGISTNYGDGDCNYGPLTTLEVVGHEFTHGVVEYTSKLVYSEEPGAINESLADIFGKLLEFKTTPGNFSWDLGHSFILTPGSKPFRVLDDPNSVEMPAFYQGNFWSPFEEVHTNSAIGNLWFTMIVDGKQGTNEIGEGFNVPGIGMAKAGDIVFLTNTAYLTANSNYADFRKYSIQAAEELFGANSQEANAVTEAWMAVGVSDVPTTAIDLAISADGTQQHGCGLLNPIPLYVRVSNLGSQPYLASQNNGVVTLDNFDLGAVNITITEDILPGESVVLTVNNWFIPQFSDTYYFDIVLDFQDEKPDNNYAYSYFDVSEHQANDLSVFVYPESSKCFPPTLNTFFYMQNKSCESLAAGTLLQLNMRDEMGNLLWNQPYELESEVPPFQYVFANHNIDVSNLSNGAGVQFEVVLPNDQDESNNSSFEEIYLRGVVTKNYLNQFDDEFALDSDTILSYDNYSFNPIVELGPGSYFGVTGNNEDPAFASLCPEILENFSDQNLYNGLNGIIRVCVDHSSFANSTLSFDLTQFRNELTAPGGDPHSSMFLATWEGSGSGSQLIIGQAEATEQHHQIALPTHFKGEVVLKFFTQLGVGDIYASDLNLYDFILLDNLELSGSSSTQESELGVPVQIAPNPSTGFVNVIATETIKRVGVYQAEGKMVFEMNGISSQAQLDLTNAPAGFYLIKVELENGQSHVSKLVKSE
jgi:Zn-dependent metalloprotease